MDIQHFLSQDRTLVGSLAMSLITAFLYAVNGAVTVNRNRNRTQKFTPPPTPGFLEVFLILVVGIFGFLPSVLVFIGSLFFHVTIWVSQ